MTIKQEQEIEELKIKIEKLEEETESEEEATEIRMESFHNVGRLDGENRILKQILEQFLKIELIPKMGEVF